VREDVDERARYEQTDHPSAHIFDVDGNHLGFVEDDVPLVGGQEIIDGAASK